MHIGLGYNCIDYYMFVRLCRVFPNLFCLDLSYNNVTELTYVISGLKDLHSLKMLYLTGNPVSLTPRYRDIMKQNLENVKILDGIPAYLDSDSPSKRKKKAAVIGLDKNIEISWTGTLDL